MKVFFRTVHLYLALAAGLVIMLSCLTGAIMVFEDELDQMFNHDRYYVEKQSNKVPLEALLKMAVKEVPGAKLSAVKIFSDPLRSVEVALILAEQKDHKGKDRMNSQERSGAKGRMSERPKGGRKPGVFVYVNPYTGEVLDVFKKQGSFFFTVEMLHRFLLGGQNSIGKTIVGLSTFSFLIITLTGIVLWWPKNKKILMQRLKFKTNGSFKRLNHDLHIVTGFYTSIFLIIIIMTGLIMAFTWINEGIFSITGSKMENPEPPSSFYQAGIKKILPEAAVRTINLSHAEYYTVRIPKDSAAAYSIIVLPEGMPENRFETYFIDQYTGHLLGVSRFADKNLGQKIRSYVKPIHTGAVFGMPTKILNFILALLTFTFPITGVIMWLNRIKKRPGTKLIRE